MRTGRPFLVLFAVALALAISIPSTRVAGSTGRPTIKGDTYAINAADDSVLMIDSKWKKQDGERVATSKVVATITGFDGASDLTVGDDYVWVANSGGKTVSKIDRSTNETVSEITVGTNARSVELFNDRLLPGTRRGLAALVGVLYGKRNVALLDAETDAVLGTVKVGKNPLRIRGDAFAPHLVSVNESTYSIIDAVAALGRSSRTPVKDTQRDLCQPPSHSGTFMPAMDIGDRESTTYSLYRIPCWMNGNGAGQGLVTLLLVEHTDPSNFMGRNFEIPTAGQIHGVKLDFEELFPGGPAIPAFFLTVEKNSTRGEGATAYAVWDYGDPLELGSGRALAQNFFADDSAAARSNGDALVVGPINCPNPSGSDDPFCGSAQFANGLKTVAKVPSGANITVARLAPNLIPDPPFGQ